MRPLPKNTSPMMPSQMLTVTRCLTLVCALVGTSLSANAGFLDSISNLNNTINSIGNTASNIKSSKQNVEDLGADVGITQHTATTEPSSMASGAVLVGKLQKTPLYASADKASAVIATLSANEVMIYMGSESNGYYFVQSDKGEGWVAKPLVKVQY